jgi:hypothetical protein
MSYGSHTNNSPQKFKPGKSGVQSNSSYNIVKSNLKSNDLQTDLLS